MHRSKFGYTEGCSNLSEHHLGYLSLYKHTPLKLVPSMRPCNVKSGEAGSLSTEAATIPQTECGSSFILYLSATFAEIVFEKKEGQVNYSSVVSGTL